jgi:hypothetical protein
MQSMVEGAPPPVRGACHGAGHFRPDPLANYLPHFTREEKEKRLRCRPRSPPLYPRGAKTSPKGE